MGLQARLEEDLKTAMREQAEVKKATLRMALSEIKFSTVERGRPLNDDEVVAVLRKEVQKRRETIEGAQQAGRVDLVDQAEAEIVILDTYLPPSLSKPELDQLVLEAIRESGAASPADLGKVMKILMPRLGGRASGSDASQAVRELLS
jgi:uncharacterized protein